MRKIVGTQVCLELPWDSSHDEEAVEWCVCVWVPQGVRILSML